MQQVYDLATLIRRSAELNNAPIVVPTDDDVIKAEKYADGCRHGPIISVRRLLKDGLDKPSTVLVYDAAAVLEAVLTTPGISYINVKDRFNVTGIDQFTPGEYIEWHP